MSLIIPANTLASGGYEVANSLRFNSGSSDYLTRTPSSASNRRTCTVSLWVKQSILTGNRVFFDQEVNGSNFIRFYLDSNNRLAFYIEDSSAGGTQALLKPSALLRDVSAWYHFVIAVDVTQATESNRVKMYINGELQTSFNDSNYPSQNLDIEGLNTTNPVDIGRRTSNNDNLFNGYISEFCFIDGLALAADQFGEFDEDNGIWKPIDVSGLTFGTNGFYLETKQSGTSQNSSGLGADTSGNDNHFAVNNLTAIDQTTDTPTNNFATANPLLNTTPTYSDGNLTIVTTNGNNLGGVSTIGVNTGKWYAEFKVIANNTCAMLGIDSNPSESARLDASGEAFPGKYVTGYGYLFNGYIFNYGGLGEITYGDTYTTNDIIGIALDLDNNKLYFSKNGTFQNSGVPTSGATGTGALSITASSSQPTGNYFFVTADGSRARASTFSCNFGSPPFAISSGNTDGNGYGNFEYAVPSGYYALNTKNLAEYG